MVDRKITTLYIDTDFWAQGELCEGFLFLHCDVYKWDRATLRKIKKHLDEFISEVKNFNYDKDVFTYTENPRWVKLLGAEYHNSFEFEGRHFEVWKWASKQ